MLGVLLAGATLPASYAAEARLQASLITCSPGREVYELFGHEALRIRGIDEKGLPVDSVWNYGVFDFAAPNFIYRFVKGETDYMVMPAPMNWFMGGYVERGSGVTEQDLNLTPQETYTLRKLLQLNSLPQNRTYRYNYVRDNCATRIIDIIDAAVAPNTIIYPDTIYYPTFRSAMRELHKNYPWYQFGIDLVLGGGLDMPVRSREEMFAPLLMEQKAAHAHFSDGEPLVKATRILYAGPMAGKLTREQIDRMNPDLPALKEMGNTLPATPWWLSPLAVTIAICIIAVGISIWQCKKREILRWVYCLFFGVLGVLGSVVWFLVFFSSHDSTSPNLMSMWLNPLQFAIAIFIWWRHTRGIATAMAVVDLIALLMLSLAWPLQLQVANPAVFPLWGAMSALCLSLVWIEIKQRKAVQAIKVAPKRRKSTKK